ncbi:MAG: hypothetical protein WDW38_010543 [Sanguina aurantia]
MTRTVPLDPSKAFTSPKVQDWCVLAGTRVSLPTNVNDTPVAMINVNALRCSSAGKGYSGGTLVSEWQRKQSFAPNPRPGRITGDNRYPSEYAANFDPTTQAYTTRLQSIYGGSAYCSPKTRPKKQRGFTAPGSGSGHRPRLSMDGNGDLMGASQGTAEGSSGGGLLGSSADPRGRLPFAPTTLNQKPSNMGWIRMTVPNPPESISRTAYGHRRMEFQQLDPTSSSRARILIGSSVKSILADRVTAQLLATQARFTPTWGSMYKRDFNGGRAMFWQREGCCI